MTAAAVGKATITATTVNGLEAACEITVAEIPASGIVIDKGALGITGDNLEMRVGDIKTIHITVEPATTTDKSVTFASSDPSIAGVDADGKVTAFALGETTITITAKSGVSTTINVTVVATPAALITLNKTEATLKATETVALEATVGPETTTDKTVTWTTSDASIATVDENGVVTAVTVGKATITATTVNGLKATSEITVVATPAASITLNKTEATLKATETVSLEATVAPDTTTDKSVIWSSSDSNIATVDENGVITAVAVGKATITATTANGLKAECEITVVESLAASISLNKSEATLKATETVSLEATIGPETTTDKTVTWTTSDDSIATVDENGIVTAVAVGNATITATTANGLKATCEITVAETPASGIVIDKDALGITGDNLEMRVGDTKTINVSVEPATTTDKSVTFSSSNAEVATVYTDGKVTALALGETTITITAKSGVSTTINVTVVATPAASITLNKAEATLKATETVALEATVGPETTTNKSVTWSTSDASIGTVDENGVVTAVAVGKATITATTANGLKATCEITVAETPASGIVIDKDALGITGNNLEMRVGDTKTINVTVEPATATDKTITFSSSNAEVATVDADGKVTALALGETTITITARSGVSASITVNVVATSAASITLNKIEATLKATETVALEATIDPETTTDKSVTWSTSDASIATVDEDGVVTAVAVGNATITATTANGLKASCKITVAETPASGIVIDKDALGITGDNLEMRVGDSKTINVTVEPTTTTDKTVTFASSDPAVATVDADGKVTALSLGETTITITAKSGVSTSIIVNVVATPASSITLNKTEATLKATETVSLEATVSPETTTDKSVTWSTSDASIATVDEDGVVTAVAVGKAIITATTANGLTASCDITVLHRDVPAAEAAINGELFDILSGEKLKLKVNYIGGLESGWSFDWRINDCQQSEGNKAEYEFAKSTAGEYRVSVHVANNCDGELIYDNTFIITVNVWARPELPGGDDIDVNTPVSAIGSDNVVRVRQNDILILDVAEGQGGYDNGWTYDWNTDGTAIGEGLEIETVATMNAGDTKAIERHTYTVNVKNTSPDGAVWAENTLSIATDVYRRPATPSSLVRKGDGTTHTLICMLTVADNQLAPLGYSFVYGYEATDGSEHEIARTTKRYCRASEQVYNNPSNRFWVYAVWTYDDGCTVSSGKRYLDGSVDEEFNASVFDPSQTGTRGADFSNSANWINVSGKSVGISVDSDSDTFISVFTAGGIMIRSLTVEAGTSVREQIDLSTLSDGIYIVNVTSGNEAVSRKFIIK
ncbi:Ig-like domain-containing protein [Duncaniella muris]|uniref:Ig-like domain-containing protein n=3 Tax=Duncaniella muris TaxID=2094150 RepID=UPI0025A94F62|nr:Ig-like domain-containing protein [Duncaniella muris]